MNARSWLLATRVGKGLNNYGDELIRQVKGMRNSTPWMTVGHVKLSVDSLNGKNSFARLNQLQADAMQACFAASMIVVKSDTASRLAA